MNVQANTDHAAMAEAYIVQANKLCFTDIGDDQAHAMAHVQATNAVAHAILAMVHELREQAS